jgi:hypothetical protein
VLPGGTAKITLGAMRDFRRRGDQSAWLSGIWMTFLIHLGLERNCWRGRLLSPQLPRASERSHRTDGELNVPASDVKTAVRR